MGSLIAACVAFVGLHFLLSHPLRKWLVGFMGERLFVGFYSLVAIASFVAMVRALGRVAPQPLWWAPGDAIWAVASVAMLVGSILFIGSLFGNPAFPNPGARAQKIGEARGVFAITRHPMMWGFAIWALVHVAVFPTGANAVLTGAILALALIGSALQDRKKAELVPSWREWQARTSYFPFAAQLAGRARWTLGDMRAILGGTAVWLIATKLHVVLGGAMEAGDLALDLDLVSLAEGGCLCGAVRYRVSGSPYATSLCHCRSCRLATGAPSLAWVIFPEDKVEIIAGEPGRFLSSPGVEWGFCGACGTTLTYRRANRPGYFDVTTASLDDPEAFPPQKEIWAGERLSWMPSNDAIPQFTRTSIPG